MKRFITACAQIAAAPNAVTENLEKVKTWVRRERRKAESLREHLEAAAKQTEREVAKLARGEGGDP